MSPRTRHVFGAAVLATIGSMSALQAAEGNLTDESVAARISSIQARLVDAQQGDGAWGRNGQMRLGETALTLLALKASGLPNEHPAIVRGTRYVVGQTSSYVYAEGLVPCALELIDPARYRERIRTAFRFLAKAQAPCGGWTYHQSRGNFDNSNTQFAVLGIAAAQRSGVLDNADDRVLYERVRKSALGHWHRTQTADGGWAYAGNGVSTLSMTCAGIASLHLLGERLERPGPTCGEYRTNVRMKRALERLGVLLKGGAAGRARRGPYALYALERVGVLLNVRTIGDCDWYRVGAARVVRRMSVTRHGRSSSDDAFKLLFLAKGNSNIAIAKWKWDGDWNNDHADVSAWVDVAGRALGKRLDWWESPLGEPDGPAAKASLIFVNGHGRFHATEKELSFLRNFLLKRGTVVAEACCNSKEFFESFAKTMCEKLFPGQTARFAPIRASHPLCSILHGLTPEEIGAYEFRAACRRPKLILLRRDISCALNGEAAGRGELDRAHKVCTNLLTWAMLTRTPKGKLNHDTLEDDMPEVLTVDQVARDETTAGRSDRLTMGRLIHRGEWDTDRHFFPRLKKALEGKPSMPRFETELHVSPTSLDLYTVPFLFLTGHDRPRLTEEEYLPLRQYLQNGGFMFVSNCCTTDKFDAGLRQLVRRLLPNDELEKIPKGDPVWCVPNDRVTTRPQTTQAYRERFGDDWAPLYGVRRDGRWILIYTAVDACCALEGDTMEDVPGYRRGSAVALISNVINRAFAP